MIYRNLNFALVLLGLQTSLMAQITTDINIVDDAFIETRANLLDNRENTNFGDNPLAPAHAWTAGGDAFVRRYFLDVDLSSLPFNIEIISAEIHFFSYGIHNPLSHDNDSRLDEMSGTWTEMGIKWNNQNSLTPTGQFVTLASSDAGGSNNVNLDYVVDVSTIISDNFNVGQKITPFRLKLNNENYYSRLIFCSSDHSNSQKRPFIRVTYRLLSAYAETKRVLDGSYHKCIDGKLDLKFNEDYLVNGTLQIKIYDRNNSVVYQPTSFNESLGVNLYNLDLKATSLFVDQGFYRLELTNAKGNTEFLRFQYND